MDATTLTTLTFTLKQGATPIEGTVNFAGFTATFSPLTNLASDATFTATITTGAKDLAGNALASNFEWTFSTGAHLGPAPVNLQSAGNFLILAGSTVTNTGPSHVNGDLGLSPGLAVTGFPPGIVTGTMHISDPIADQAKLDLTTAFNDAKNRALNVVTLPTGELGGHTYTPGLYKSGISSFAITSVDLTLDAQGDSNAVFIFQMPSSTLTVGNARKVILAGNAKAANIFWQVGSSATLGTTSDFKGNILADQSITMQTGATLEGRILTRIAAVTLDSNTITVPIP
jgi:hypothetical protein